MTAAREAGTLQVHHTAAGAYFGKVPPIPLILRTPHESGFPFFREFNAWRFI